jgi:hypothetical protein
VIAQRPLVAVRPHVMGVAKFERFFGTAADVVGGLSVALARAFKIINPDRKNPATEHWRCSFQIFDLLL